MKIAVATMDGESVSQHFGQSRGFLVFDVDEKTIVGKELRTGQSTPHDDICGHGNGQGPGRMSMFDLLRDCHYLLCGGMGAGAAQNLQANGIKPVVIPGIASPDQAVTALLSGDFGSGPMCDCHH